MSHFLYTRPGGVWNPGTALLAAEMASLDAKTFAAINGDGGGVWAPSSVIEIGGSGLTVSGPFTASGTSVTNNLEVGGNLQVDGPALFEDDVTFDGSSATFNNAVTLGSSSGDAILVKGAANFNAGVNFNNGANVTAAGLGVVGGISVSTGGLTVSSGSTSLQALFVAGNLGGTPTLAAKMATSGTGRVVPRYFDMLDSNQTKGPTNTDIVIVPAGVLSADRDLTIDDTNAVDGDVMHFANFHEPTLFLVVKRPGGSVLQSIRNAATGSSVVSITAIRRAGVWEALAIGRGAP